MTIAGTDRIRSGKDKNGLYLADTKSALVARPGDAIDAEIILPSSAGGVPDLLAAGWPVWNGCGSGLAIVHSVARD